MALHIIMSRSPALLRDLDAVTSSKDQLLFLGDGCYQIHRWSGKGEVFASSDDLNTRGLTLRGGSDHVTPLNDQQWATLITSAEKTVSW